MEPSDRVSVPRWALGSLVGIAVVALLGVAFLLGRESARPTAAPVAPAPVVAARPAGTLQETRPEALPPPPARPAPVAEAPPGVTVQATPVAVAPPAPAAPGASSPAAAPVDPAERQQVADYFRALEASVGAASVWQNPDVVANTVLGQGAQGDSSGFDMLLDANRQALARVRAVRPPEPCRRHHQLTVQVMNAGLQVLQRVRQATMSGDAGVLTALATEGQQLQSRILELEALGNQIKSRYSL